MKHFIGEFPNYYITDDGQVFNGLGDRIKTVINKGNGMVNEKQQEIMNGGLYSI